MLFFVYKTFTSVEKLKYFIDILRSKINYAVTELFSDNLNETFVLSRNIYFNAVNIFVLELSWQKCINKIARAANSCLLLILLHKLIAKMFTVMVSWIIFVTKNNYLNTWIQYLYLYKIRKQNVTSLSESRDDWVLRFVFLFLYFLFSVVVMNRWAKCVQSIYRDCRLFRYTCAWVHVLCNWLQAAVLDLVINLNISCGTVTSEKPMRLNRSFSCRCCYLSRHKGWGKKSSLSKLSL